MNNFWRIQFFGEEILILYEYLAAERILLSPVATQASFGMGLCRKAKIAAQPHIVLCESRPRRLSAMEVAADDAQHSLRVFVGQRYFVAVIRA